tara:strand:- start:1040 stop:1237 length:198 start_codon:yes stop_codon:yes gene_type:complete
MAVTSKSSKNIFQAEFFYNYFYVYVIEDAGGYTDLSWRYNSQAAAEKKMIELLVEEKCAVILKIK